MYSIKKSLSLKFRVLGLIALNYLLYRYCEGMVMMHL